MTTDPFATAVSWRHVRPGDTIRGKDGNHWIVCTATTVDNEFFDVTLWREATGVYTGVASGEVYIIERPTETAVTELHAAKLIFDDEYRGILDRLRRQHESAYWHRLTHPKEPTREQAGF